MRARLWTILGASVVVFAGASSCAQGSSISTGGSGPGGSGGAGPGPTSTTGDPTTNPTSSTGDTTTGTTSTGDTTTSTTSTTATTSTGSSCTENPCKLTPPQCGCAAGEQCSLVGVNRQCIPAGNVGQGQDCGASDCSVGLQCIQTTPTVATCMAFCEDDNDCVAPGGLCVVTLSDGMGGSIPDATLCTENCNPISNVGCPVAGTSCQVGQESTGLMRFLTFCTEAGNKTQYALCNPSANDCAPGYGCFNDGIDDLCLKYCDFGNGGVCPAGASCFDIQVQIGNTFYGACY
jgi:hypothetical protein